MTLIRFPIGVSDFEKLATGNYLFVDKTLFVKDIIEDGAKAILITRPRRFGKTLNMSMMKYFFDVQYKNASNIFTGLNIAKHSEFCEKHQSKYPVIFISFKDIKEMNYTSAYKHIAKVLSDLYSQHRYLLEGNILQEDEIAIFKQILYRDADEETIKTATADLSEYLHRKYQQKAIILIDEYDTPLQEAYLATVTDNIDTKDRSSYYSQMIVLMRGIFGSALKDNQYLAKAVVTGITRVAQESLFSGLNNLKVYTMLSKEHGQYFGFTENEVESLVKRSNVNASMQGIKEWYNGYQIGNFILYNPWSIINCLDEQGELQPYWLNTGGSGLIDLLLSKSDVKVKAKFERLLQNQIIEQSISEDLVFADLGIDEDALWSLLIYAGYLDVLSRKLEGSRWQAQISVPNKEVSFIYDKIVEQWFGRVTGLEEYDEFVASLANGNMEQFKYYLETYIMETGSYFDFNHNTPEQIFHIFVLGLTVGLRKHYIISSNRESGRGRLDVSFMPKDKARQGIVIEFKTALSPELMQEGANAALKQIRDKQYAATFRQNSVTSLLAIGICLCGKELELVHKIMSA